MAYFPNASMPTEYTLHRKIAHSPNNSVFGSSASHLVAPKKKTKPPKQNELPKLNETNAIS